MKIETTQTIKESTYFNSVKWVKVNDIIEHITETKKSIKELSQEKRLRYALQRYYSLLEELQNE